MVEGWADVMAGQLSVVVHNELQFLLRVQLKVYIKHYMYVQSLRQGKTSKLRLKTTPLSPMYTFY